MRKRGWAVTIAIFVILAIVLLAIATLCPEKETLPESKTDTINLDSLRKIHQSLPPRYVIECDSVYRLNEDNLETLEDSIHFYEDGF